MALPETSPRLKKELSLLGVYAIATGTTLSAGFFLLPGLAVEQAGPAVVLSYLIAAALLVPAMLSIVELATAMPRAGGAYYFLDRSLGPLAGTVGGMGTWLALTLKTAFALVGMGAYFGLFFPQAPMTVIAVGFALFFGVLNVMGSKKTAGIQIVLVTALLTILVWFIVDGGRQIELSHFEGFFDEGAGAILSTAGVVFISYVGVTKIASVSEEVKDPERNLPLGVFLALGTAVTIYALGITVMVGHVPIAELTAEEHKLTPVAAAAETFAGRFGTIIVSIAAILAFSSVANGGILSASRYPMAMARDHLMPEFFSRLSGRGMPVRSIVVTVGAVVVIVFVEPLEIAKLASTFQLLIFALLSLAVIVMRESRIESYDPGYRSPWYPWLHLVGIAGPMWIISEMGWLPMLFTIGLIIIGVLWYVYYARARVERHGAIYHVFERLGRRRFDDLDRELRSIMKEKGLRAEDPFDELIMRAMVIDADASQQFAEIVQEASQMLSQRLPIVAESLVDGFMQGTQTGVTPVSAGVALPHLRVPGISGPHVVLVRARTGIEIATGGPGGEVHTHENTYALFFLVSPDDDPGRHLRLLAQLASRVDQDDFLTQWLDAPDEHRLREVLVQHDRYRSLVLARGTSSEPLIDRAIRDLDLPVGCLLAVIRRGRETIVPRGDTMLREGDHVSVIGSEKAMAELYARYGREAVEPEAGVPEEA